MNKIILNIKTLDFNFVYKNHSLMSQLRKLTLHGASGMRTELDALSVKAKTHKVKTKILLAYSKQKLVGWALLSKEPSNWYFSNIENYYNPKYGLLFEVFVDESFRRKGIGTALVTEAKKKARTHKLCFAPWDMQSRSFYSNFKHYDHVEL